MRRPNRFPPLPYPPAQVVVVVGSQGSVANTGKLMVRRRVFPPWAGRRELAIDVGSEVGALQTIPVARSTLATMWRRRQ
jgi:hypothetical protein